MSHRFFLFFCADNLIFNQKKFFAFRCWKSITFSVYFYFELDCGNLNSPTNCWKHFGVNRKHKKKKARLRTHDIHFSIICLCNNPQKHLKLFHYILEYIKLSIYESATLTRLQQRRFAVHWWKLQRISLLQP